MPYVDYLTAVVKPLLKHPDTLTIQETTDKMGVLLTVEVHPEDMGTMIGREGQTAKSVRHLLRIVGACTNARVSVKINEPAGSTYKRK